MNKEIKERIESIKNNQLPKGYRRVKDIGISPEDWTIGKMSDVIENVSRPVPKPNEPYWRLGIKSWAKGTFHAFVDDPETVNMDELYEVKENDLIVNITFAWEHAIAIAKKEDEGLLVSHRFPTYVFKEGQVPEYYQAVVTQRYFKDMLDHISPGGAGRNRVLNRKDFLNLPCYIPSNHEQGKISEILSVCNNLIDLKEELIKEKERQKEFIAKRLFSCKKSIPLSDLAKITMGQSPDSKSYNVIFDGIPLLQGNADIVDGLPKARYYTNKPTKECNVDDILLSVRAPVGSVSRSNIKACIGRGLCAITAGDLTEYIYQYLKFYERHWIKVSQGSTFTAINGDEIGKILIPFENHNKSKYTSQILSTIDNEIKLLSQERDEYLKIKKALLSYLLTGIVRV